MRFGFFGVKIACFSLLTLDPLRSVKMFAQLSREVHSAMENRPSNVRRRAAVVLLLSLAAVVGHGQAGMLPMYESVADFRFDDGELNYWPSVDGDDLSLTSDNAVMLTVHDGTGGHTQTGLAAHLRLRADIQGNRLLDGDFNVFGTLNDAAGQTTSELVSGTLQAMAVSREGDMFHFMFVGESVTGDLALHYRNIGLFTRVAGIADEEWASEFDSSASLMNVMGLSTMRLEPANARPRDGATPNPAPATALLLLGGLLPLLIRRRARV